MEKKTYQHTYQRLSKNSKETTIRKNKIKNTFIRIITNDIIPYVNYIENREYLVKDYIISFCDKLKLKHITINFGLTCFYDELISKISLSLCELKEESFIQYTSNNNFIKYVILNLCKELVKYDCINLKYDQKSNLIYTYPLFNYYKSPDYSYKANYYDDVIQPINLKHDSQFKRLIELYKLTSKNKKEIHKELGFKKSTFYRKLKNNKC